MNRYCEGLILSKKGFGEGHLLLNFLDSNFGKIKLASYGSALETGSRRSVTLSGSFIEGLVIQSRQNPNHYQISDIKIISTLENIRSELKSMGFAFFTLEILDLMLMENDIFPYYKDLSTAFQLFDETLDEKYVLFFIAKFLSGEGWINDPIVIQRLKPQTQRFINDAHHHEISFLKGKNISTPRKQELSYFFAHITKQIRGKIPKSLELLIFSTEDIT